MRKSLFVVSSKWDSKFKNLVGLFICNNCRRDIYRSDSEEFFPNAPQEEENIDAAEEEVIDTAEEQFSDVVEEEGSDPTFECKAVDDTIKLEKINSLLEEMGEPKIKKSRFSKLCSDNQLHIFEIVKNPGQNKKTIPGISDEEAEFINGIKAALSNADTILHKIQILTTIPPNWTIKKMRRELHVSRRMARRAKKLRKNSGHGSRPVKKQGRKIPDWIIKKVRAFYSFEENSRVLPGMGDFVSIVENGQRTHVQKKLLLFNVNELHEKFKKDFPEASISLSKFRKLRPQECISAGQRGTHNVCVCKTHENFKLRIAGLKQELQKKGVHFSKTYHDFIKLSVCNVPNQKCFFSDCKECPGTESIVKELAQLFEENGISTIKYSLWNSTDR